MQHVRQRAPAGGAGPGLGRLADLDEPAARRGGGVFLEDEHAGRFAEVLIDEHAFIRGDGDIGPPVEVRRRGSGELHQRSQAFLGHRFVDQTDSVGAAAGAVGHLGNVAAGAQPGSRNQGGVRRRD